MLYYYKIKLWKDHKKKLFCSFNNSVDSKSVVTNKENSYKNFQKMNFNQKHQFTVKKRFTLDWHIRPNKGLGNISKNKKFLKLASFYSQLNCDDFSKKFTYLMIFHLKNQQKKLKKIKENSTSFYLYDKTLYSLPFSPNIPKLADSREMELELEKNKKIFANLQYKNDIWFSKIFIPFSNRNFWWILLPTQKILTHIRWNLFLKRIINLLEIIKISTSTSNYRTQWNSTVFFDFFPEFLIEKPINWYWMVPFFGCIGLIRSNTTSINSSFFPNYYATSNIDNQLDLNISSTFSKNPIQNNISWETFHFFDYKKFLFDSSFKYINNCFFNHNNFVIQIKKTWFSRQKEHYICNYQDALVKKDLKKNVNQLTKLALIYWWKKNWQEITYPQFALKLHSIDNVIPFKKNKYVINNMFLSTNKKVYSFDSLFYSTFYWYWHNLDTKNITDFFHPNYSKILSKNQLPVYEKESVYKNLSKTHSATAVSLFDSLGNLINKLLLPVGRHTGFIHSPYNHFFSSNLFPLKIQYPWLIYHFKNSQIKQKTKTQKNDNYNSIIEIINQNFKNIQIYEINLNNKIKNKNEYKKNIIQQKKFNLIYKHILYSNFFKNQGFKDLIINTLCLKNISRSSFLFCVSPKNRSRIKLNEIKDLEFRKQEIPSLSSVFLKYKNQKVSDSSSHTHEKFQNKQKDLLKFTFYDSIGCEVFEADFYPLSKLNNIQSNKNQRKYNEITKWSLADTKNLQANYHNEKKQFVDSVDNELLMSNDPINWKKQNTKKNQSISSFHRASFLLENLLSKFCFELGNTWLPTDNFINDYYKILNIKNFGNNPLQSSHLQTSVYSTFTQKIIVTIHNNPIIMSGYNQYDLNSSLKLKERNQILREFANTMTHEKESYLRLSPNVFYNKKKLDHIFNSNKLQYTKPKLHSNKVLNLNFGGSYFSSINQQQLCILRKKYKHLDLKSKELERFFISNLLDNPKTLLSKFIKLERNIKKIEYNKKFFNIKTNSKYKITRTTPLLDLQSKIRKIKKHKKLINIANKKDNGNLVLLNYSDFLKKKEISFSSMIFPKDLLSRIKIKKNNIYSSFNNTPHFHYVSNKSIFWNYINSIYSFRLLDATQPFIFDKLDDFLQNIRINRVNKNTQNFKNSYFFSNLLLKKYQRKNQNWPGGANPQGFFYKRINKLNFKSIKKKQFIEQIQEGGRSKRLDEFEVKINFKNQSKQLKKVSEFKPIGELLWEVRTKHKTPEVLLLQQTLFFQKKLVRKSTEDNTVFNQYSSENTNLSQKVQTLVRKMTQRRSFRKHVFLDNLFNWTRHSIALRKMLRKINFKNDWQVFLKFILNVKKTSRLSPDSNLPDYYSHWYKNSIYNDKKFVTKYLLSDSLKINISFSNNFKKTLKTDNIRPFLHQFIQNKNNKKLLVSKKTLSLFLNGFYNNNFIEYSLLNANSISQPLPFLKLKKKKTRFYKKLDTLYFFLLKDINYFNNLLIFPESNIFYYFSLPKFFIQTQIQNLSKKRNNLNRTFNSASLILRSSPTVDSLSSCMKKNQHSLVSFNTQNNSNDSFNKINSYYFINQQNLSKTCFPLYNEKQGSRGKDFNINKKSLNATLLHNNLASPVGVYKNLLVKNKTQYEKKQKSKQIYPCFLLNFSNRFNVSKYYKIYQSQKFNKFFQIPNKYKNTVSSYEPTSLLGTIQTPPLHVYSDQLSIRNRLFYQKLYFTNIFWHSNEFLLTSTIFNENELIKNNLIHNWVFQIRRIDAAQNYQKELNFNFHTVLATLSTWQYKFQIRRDLILQLFYIYLDHIGAFLNYVINNLIFENIVNQIENWFVFNEIDFVIKKEPLKQDKFSFNFKNELIIQPTWSFDLLNHIKTQYPHLYNTIQKNNQSNFENIQVPLSFSSNLLIKTPELNSKKQIIFSPSFKTQLLLIDSFRKNSGKRSEFLKTYNMLSNTSTNSINNPFVYESIIQKLSSESLIIRNSTLFCQKWIQNKNFLNLYKIKLLKKQQKLRQILNLFQENKKNSLMRFEKQDHNIISMLSSNYNFKKNHSLYKNRSPMNFKRRTGFLFNRSLATTDFNSFSSLSNVTRGSISLYLNKNLEYSVQNFLFFSQILLLHVCLICCLISVYHSAFHFCFKNCVSFFVILIHYFLNIKYRLKRLIKYIYQSTAQSFITNIQEYLNSFDSIHNQLFLFFNNLSTLLFSNKFLIWGKIYKSSIPSFIDFLFKNPLLEKTLFLKSKNQFIVSEQSYINNRGSLGSFNSFFYNIKQNYIINLNQKGLFLNMKKDVFPKTILSQISNQKKANNRMSLLRNRNVLKKWDWDKNQKNLPNSVLSNKREALNNASISIFWDKINSNPRNLLKILIKKEKIKKFKDKNNSTFQLNFKLLKWNLGLVLLIGESEIFAELEPYREMHWYFLKRLPVFLRSNTYSEDPINMYDYQADEKLRKFKEQFKKATEIFQKRQTNIERKTQRNLKKEYVENKVNHGKFTTNSEKLTFELINKKYTNKENTNNFLETQKNTETLILFIKSEKNLKDELITVHYLKKISDLFNNLYFFRKKVSRGQPFWKPLFSFLAHTLFISRLSKLNRRFRDSLLIMNYSWIPFGPLMAILSTFLWKNSILNFSNVLNKKNSLVLLNESSTKKYKNFNQSLLISLLHLQNDNFKKNNQVKNLNKLNLSLLLKSQNELNKKNNLQFFFASSDYSSPFKMNIFSDKQINKYEYKQFSQELNKIWQNVNYQNSLFSEFSPPLFNRVFLWNFIKFEKKYERAVLKWMNPENKKNNEIQFNFMKSLVQPQLLLNSKISDDSNYRINKYQSIYINNQEQSAQNRYIHYHTYDPKVRLYRFYTNFSKNFNDIGIIQDAKNVHPIFGSLLCEIYSGLFSLEANRRKRNIFQKQFSNYQYQRSSSSSTKNILLIGNTNSSNFVLLVQAFAAETGLKLFMEDAKRLRRLGRRGINKSTKRLEKLFEVAQSHSPSIIFLEDIDVIGSKRRVIKINEEEDDEDMAIRSFFSKLLYRKQHNSKSLSKSFVHQNLFINNQEIYRNMQKSILPESPIPSNLIKYQLTRRKAFSNYFSNTSNSSYKTFITKFNSLRSSSIDSNLSNNFSSSPTNAVIIWKLLKSKLVTPKKTIKEAPWEHIPVDSMRSIPLITYSIRVKVAKLTMLAIYTMNTQLRLVKDLIKLLEKIQYESYKGFIVFATTNKLATLDPSLRRPGRFDETVYLPSLTVNPTFQHVGKIHFFNVLSIDSQDFVNFSRTFNNINASNFTMNWNINRVYNNVFLQDNSAKLFYPNKISLRDLINSTADNVYNQNIFMQNQNNVYLNFVSYDILGNIGFQKPNFSIYSKSVVLLSLAYSKSGQLITNLFLKQQFNDNEKNTVKVTKSRNLFNTLAFNSENNELTLWPNSHIFSQFKKINISYTSQQKNIKNWLIYYFAGKIGEFCFFSFYKHMQNNKNTINSKTKTKLNYFFDNNSFGLRSLYGIQPNWKNINSIIFFLIRTSCFYSKNHLTSKLFYFDDISTKRQEIFSENLGPSLLYEYFNLNKEYFLKRNKISLEEQLQKQQMQKYLLNLQQKPLRKFLLNSTGMNITKNRSYFNKVNSQNNLPTELSQHNIQNGRSDSRLALFRILFNELGSLDLIALRPTAMNYYYDKKILSKHRFRKYTYKWWNWHLKRTIDSLEEFQYLDFFPYADKQYNPRRQRWILTNGYSAYWLAQEKILYYQIYEQLIIECFQRSYIHIDKHREMLDYLVQLLLTKQLLTEIEWIFFVKRFI